MIIIYFKSNNIIDSFKIMKILRNIKILLTNYLINNFKILKFIVLKMNIMRMN